MDSVKICSRKFQSCPDFRGWISSMASPQCLLPHLPITICYCMHDPIKKFQPKVLSFARTDQLEKPKMIMWLIWLVEFQRRVEFCSIIFLIGSAYNISPKFRNILAQALLELHKKENVTEAPSNCNASGSLWQTGKTLFEYIRNQVLIIL